MLFQDFFSQKRSLVNNSLIAASICIQLTVFIYSKYLNCKRKVGPEGQSNLALSANTSANSKYTVSLGSALFFAMILIGGVLGKYTTRNLQLLFLWPLQSTEMSVFFPLLIILNNPKLKDEFVLIVSTPFKQRRGCFNDKKIAPII